MSKQKLDLSPQMRQMLVAASDRPHMWDNGYELRTADALMRKGLVLWQSGKNRGVVLTDAGRDYVLNRMRRSVKCQ